MYIEEEGGKVSNDSERDESTEEQLECNKQYIYTPYSILSPLSPAMAMRHLCLNTHMHTWCSESMPETTETRIMRLELTDPQSYCGD